MPFEQFPYTNFHELNLDWVIRKMKELSDKTDNIDELAAQVSEDAENVENIYNAIKALFVTPEMYGAVGDGITDDTAAFQEAINSGKGVQLMSNHTYKVTGLTIPADVYLYGNGSVIVGYGSGDLITVQTYSGSQDHYTLPSVIKDVKLMDADVLLKVNYALKCTFENITFKGFDTAIDFTAGYENVFKTMRFEGDPDNTSAVGVKVTGGDSLFSDFYGRDVANPLFVQSGNNIFEDFHFWIIEQSLFDSTVFVKENVGSDALNKYINFYFDSFKQHVQVNGSSKILLENPTVLASSAVISGESTLINLVNGSYNTEYLKIINASFKVDNLTLCNICNDTSKPIYMTYFPTSVAQYAKIATCNVLSYESQIVAINAADWITLASGFSIVSGTILHDAYNNIVSGNLVIESSSTLYANNTVTVGNLLIQPVSAVNTGCFLSSDRWNTNYLGYCYISTTLSVKPYNDSKFIKLTFSYKHS